MKKRQQRRIIQLIHRRENDDTDGRLFALCDDGTLWSLKDDGTGEWEWFDVRAVTHGDAK